MRISPDRPQWVLYLVGLSFFVLAFLFTDVLRHGDMWSHGQFPHRLALMLPSAIVMGVLVALCNYLLRRRKPRRSSAIETR